MEPLEKMQIIKVTLEELDKFKDQLSLTEYRYAKETIVALKILLEIEPELVSISNEDLRNNLITSKTNLIAEPGLIPGSCRQQIISSLDTRIKDFVFIYSNEKEKDRLPLFFKYAFMGPPCFNGRINTMNEYIRQATGVYSDLYFNYTTSFDREANLIENVIYDWMEQNKTTKLPSLEDLKIYLTTVEDKSLFKMLSKPNGSIILKRACEFVVS